MCWRYFQGTCRGWPDETQRAKWDGRGCQVGDGRNSPKSHPIIIGRLRNHSSRTAETLDRGARCSSPSQWERSCFHAHRLPRSVFVVSLGPDSRLRPVAICRRLRRPTLPHGRACCCGFEVLREFVWAWRSDPLWWLRSGGLCSCLKGFPPLVPTCSSIWRRRSGNRFDGQVLCPRPGFTRMWMFSVRKITGTTKLSPCNGGKFPVLVIPWELLSIRESFLMF